MNPTTSLENIPGENVYREIFFTIIKYIVFILLFIWCTGIAFPIISPSFEGKSIIQHILQYNYSLVCHQSEKANIFIGNEHFLVCARCLGIYAGALLIMVIIVFNLLKIKLNLTAVLIFIIPLFVDAIAVRLRIYDYSTIVAFLTGFLFGSILSFFIFDSIKTHLSLDLNK